MFDERGHRPLAGLLPDWERIRSEWFGHLMPDTTTEQVGEWLREDGHLKIRS